MSKHKPRKETGPGKGGTFPANAPPIQPPPRMPPDAPRLKKGDRVTFDLGPGVDGPPYAMNVRLIEDD